MKLVKLRSNQELRKQGFTHAIRFNNIYPLVSLDDETEGGEVNIKVPWIL